MKVNPYLHFKGNCAEAVKFYEGAFGIKATIYPSEDGKSILHADIGDIMFCDWEDAPDKANISVSVAYDTTKQAKVVFDKLAAGGKIEQAIDKTDWSEYWGSLTDKFGIMWQVTVK